MSNIGGGVKLVLGLDNLVASWVFLKANWRPLSYNSAIGFEDNSGQLIAAAIFCNYNGHNVDVQFYGPSYLTRRIGREIFIFALNFLKVDRLTLRSRNIPLIRGVFKLGAIHEATLRRFYGSEDTEENRAQQYVFFKEQMMLLAGIKDNKHG